MFLLRQSSPFTGVVDLFHTDPRYEFHGFVANLFIIGAALAGTAHLILWRTAN